LSTIVTMKQCSVACEACRVLYLKKKKIKSRNLFQVELHEFDQKNSSDTQSRHAAKQWKLINAR